MLYLGENSTLPRLMDLPLMLGCMLQDRWGAGRHVACVRKYARVWGPSWVPRGTDVMHGQKAGLREWQGLVTFGQVC